MDNVWRHADFQLPPKNIRIDRAAETENLRARPIALKRMSEKVGKTQSNGTIHIKISESFSEERIARWKAAADSRDGPQQRNKNVVAPSPSRPSPITPGEHTRHVEKQRGTVKMCSTRRLAKCAFFAPIVAKIDKSDEVFISRTRNVSKFIHNP